MKSASAPYLSLLMLLSATLSADDKAPSKPRMIRIDHCDITLIDHVTLSFDRAGIIKTLEFKEGNPITKGALLAQLADEVAQANLAVAEKEASNEVELEFGHTSKKAADVEHSRLLGANRLAVEKGGKPTAVSLVEIDKAKLAADKAELQIKDAEHKLGLNKLKAKVSAAELDTYSIKAGFDGVVHKIFKKRGEAVRQGDSVIEILNTDRVRVEGDVSADDLRFVKQGAKVRVWPNEQDRDPTGTTKFLEGHITFVALISEPIGRTTRVYAEIENRNNILRGGHEAVMEIEAVDPAAAQDSTSAKVETKVNPVGTDQQ
jgi:multidrug efflux pump subunit AcrA (membrane-fusion protein)